MKKSLLITLDFPPQTGGVSTYYENICQHLPPQDIAVLTSEEKGARAFDAGKKYAIYRKKLLSTNPFVWPRWMRMIPVVKKLAGAEEYEQLLVGNVLPIGTVALFLKKTRGLPYYVFTHGMDVTMPQGRKKALMEKILKNASKVFVNSQWLKRVVFEHGIAPKNIEVIYPCAGIEPDADYEKVEEIKKIYQLNNKKVLLTVGRLVERKGHDMIIRSLPLVKKIVPNVVYIIAGIGPHLVTLKKMVRKYNLLDTVHFAGKVDTGQLHALYEACDIFIMTPYKLANNDVEGFGIVYIEAAHFGKPSIAAQTGGVGEAVIHNETGLIVPPREKNQIAEALITLLTDEALAHRLGMQGMDRAYKEFRWQVQAKKVEGILS